MAIYTCLREPETKTEKCHMAILYGYLFIFTRKHYLLFKRTFAIHMAIYFLRKPENIARHEWLYGYLFFTRT